MDWTRTVLAIISMVFLSCEVPTGDFENPLDWENLYKKGVEVPALVFVPDEVTVSVGDSVELRIIALEVNNVRGVSVTVKYDTTRLELKSVKAGDFLRGGNDPLFVYEKNSQSMTLDIHTVCLGPDSLSYSGTGSVAKIVFSVLAEGLSTVTIAGKSECVDPSDEPIQLETFGSAYINVE